MAKKKKKKTEKKKKEKAEKKGAKKETKKKAKKKKKYYEGVGRRKTSTTRVRIFPKGKSQLLINDKDYKEYFPTLELQKIVEDPLKEMNCEDKFKITVLAKGGGIHSQAEAVRHGLARALVKFNSSFKNKLKKAGYLTRDPRMKERKKPGLKRARRAPQWQKR